MINKVLPDAVIFDMDGVLADTEPLHGSCFIRTFINHGINISFEDYRLAVTIGGSTVKDYFISLGGNAAYWTDIKALKDELMLEAVAQDGVLMPGVIETLEMLRSAGIQTAVATSARKMSLDIILNRFNLQPYFDAFATKDEVDAEKPSPAVFLLAAKKLGVEPADCVVIEDSPRGVMAAHRAGMKCIAIPTRTTLDGDFSLATLVTESLSNVDLDMLKSLFERGYLRESAAI